MNTASNEQLVHFLSDMYSVEQQALAQLVSAPGLAGDPAIAADFQLHHSETQRHAMLIAERLEAHGERPSYVKDLVMKLGGKGFLLFAKAQPETPGRLAAHAYSYEAMEWAGYEMLIRFATAAGDDKTVKVAKTIRDEERTMMERLESGFDAAEEASHRDTPRENLPADLRKHIGEVHALETQGIQLLTKSRKIAGDSGLALVCDHNLDDSRNHAAILEQRLKEIDGEPSALKDAALCVGGLNWALFFQAQSDTPAKLAAFTYAYEHLKIAGYELLKRTARRAGDVETEALCDTLLSEERSMADRIAATFDSAAGSTLEAVQK